MTQNREQLMSEAELDVLLREATNPTIPLGAEARLMKRLSLSGAVHEVPTKKNAVWLSALPLAASLILGVYLGAYGYGDSVFNTTSSDNEIATGIEEAELAAEEGLT